MLTNKNTHNPKLAVWMLRLGLAFVFLYAGVESLLHPVEWIGYLPHFLATSSAATAILKLIAVYELVLALWLLAGKYLRYAAALSVLTLVGIVVSGPNDLIITFRDIGLAFMAAALFFSA